MSISPSSVPPGLVVELSRQRLLPGAEDVADEWMAHLNDRRLECEATLADEHMALEVVFRRSDDDGEWLYWLQIRGSEGAELDLSVRINQEHLAFAQRSKYPGWQEATVQNLLRPPAVRRALYDAAQLGDGYDVVEPGANEEGA